MGEGNGLLHEAARVSLDPVPEGSLKLVVLDTSADVSEVLREHAGADDIKPFGRSAWVVFTSAEPAVLRDTIRAAVPDVATIVVEFERWSVSGGTVDPAWLLRRGH